MFCNYCGRKINNGISFCPYCGHGVGGNVNQEAKEGLIAALECETQKLLQLQEERRAEEDRVNKRLQILEDTYDQLKEKNIELKKKLGMTGIKATGRWCIHCGAQIPEKGRFCAMCGNAAN